jgi:hypothetical protein
MKTKRSLSMLRILGQITDLAGCFLALVPVNQEVTSSLSTPIGPDSPALAAPEAFTLRTL